MRLAASPRAASMLLCRCVSLRHGNLRGMTAMVVAVGFFAFMDTLLKVLSTRYPALQIAALRGWVALPLIVLWIQARGTWHTLWPVRGRCTCCAACWSLPC
jgi:drug/metabolite transporter (DMT)-like permease